MNKGIFGMLLIWGEYPTLHSPFVFSSQFFLVLFSVFNYTVCRAIKNKNTEVSL